MQQVARTPAHEMRQILGAQAIEVEWWGQEHGFDDTRAIFAARESGVLIPVEDTICYRVSPAIPSRYRLLRPRARDLLNTLSEAWRRHCESIAFGTLVLTVTSLTRTQEYQVALGSQGYPAAACSSHVRGYAFDIALEPLRRTADALDALLKLCTTFKNRGHLNMIHEHTIRALHICASPQWAGSHV